VHGEIHEQKCERDVEIIPQRAKERYPLGTPRIIPDNGPQFIAREFKEYIRLMGMTLVRTSPFYPQRNGKLERWHNPLKQEVIRPKVPLSLEDAKCLVSEYVNDYQKARASARGLSGRGIPPMIRFNRHIPPSIRPKGSKSSRRIRTHANVLNGARIAGLPTPAPVRSRAAPPTSRPSAQACPQAVDLLR
jgi:hypothetical protein